MLGSNPATVKGTRRDPSALGTSCWPRADAAGGLAAAERAREDAEPTGPRSN